MRSKSLAVAVLATMAVAAVFAHRKDEYLQAARVSIDPALVEIELSLTPGVALARGIVTEIDRDGNGAVTLDEAHVYSERVGSDIQVEVDGRRLSVELIDRKVSNVPALLRGEGAIQLRWSVRLPSLSAGPHRLLYRNTHRTDVGVYLANALVPVSGRVTITGQTRDRNQRELAIDYTLLADETRKPGRTRLWPGALIAGAIVLIAGVLWIRRFT